MKKKLIIAFIAVALISSGFTDLVWRFQQSGETYNSNVKVNLLESRISDLNSSLTSLSVRLLNMNVSLTRTSLDLHELVHKSSKEKNLTQQDIESLQYYVDGLQANIVMVQRNISSFQGIVNDIQSRLGTVSSDLETAQTQISDIQIQMISFAGNMSSLQTKVTEVTEDIQGLATNMTKIAKDIIDVQDAITVLQDDVSTLKTQIMSVQAQVEAVQTDISNIQAAISSLQSKTSDLATRIDILNSSKSAVIRINIVYFKPHRIPPNLNLTGEDWLMDAQVELLNGTILAQSQTGHSRFFQPKYLDLTILDFNSTQLIGQQVQITLVAYWHLNDVLIDINTNPHLDVNWDEWNLSQNALVLHYTVGTVQAKTVAGFGSNWTTLPPLYSYANLTYMVETLYARAPTRPRLGWLHTDGINIKDEQGRILAWRGIMIGQYTVVDQNVIDIAKAHDAIYLELGFHFDGGHPDTLNYTTLNPIIDLCEANNIYVVLNFLTGTYDPNFLNTYQIQWASLIDHYASRPVVVGVKLVDEPNIDDGIGSAERTMFTDAINALRPHNPNLLFITATIDWMRFESVNVAWTDISQLPQGNVVMGAGGWVRVPPQDGDPQLALDDYAGADYWAARVRTALVNYRNKVPIPVVMGAFGSNYLETDNAHTYYLREAGRLLEQEKIGHVYYISDYLWTYGYDKANAICDRLLQDAPYPYYW